MKNIGINEKSLNKNNLKVVLSFLSMTFLLYIGSTLLSPIQWDWTEEGLYTLSPGTQSLLSKMDSPIVLKLYYSKTATNKGSEGLRLFNNYFRYVKELLEEFVAKSKNQLTLEVVDPRPDTPDEEDAMGYGLKKFSISETENYFFGLVAENESGTERVIEFFNPQERDKLEYQIAKLIYTAQNPQKKIVGVLSSLDVLKENLSPYIAQLMRMQGKPVEESWLALKMAEEFYTLKKIPKDADQIQGVDTLVVIHPRDFSQKTLFAIDQFFLNGGRLLVLVDPYFVVDSKPYGGLSSSPDPGFSSLLKTWGISVPKQEYVGDKYLSGVGRISPNAPSSRILGLLHCTGVCNTPYNDPITAGLQRIHFVFPGRLVVDSNPDKVNKSDETASQQSEKSVEVTPFLGTSERGNFYKASPLELSNPLILWNRFVMGDKVVPLAYRLKGFFSSSFSQPPKGSPFKKSDSLKVLKKSSKSSALIVLPDVDFIADPFAFKKTFLGLSLANDNSTLFLNSLEALSGNVDLMSIRSKGSIDRSFDVIEQIEFAAEKKTARKVSQINGSIAQFQSDLNDLGRSANDSNRALLQNEGLRKKKVLTKKIASLKRELREVKREGRERVEAIGQFFQYLNTLLIPFLIIVFSFFYAQIRRKNLKRG